MKKFFVIFVMVIAMTMGLVGQAFANDIQDVDNESIETVAKFDYLIRNFEFVVNNHSECDEFTLISQRIFKDECVNNEGIYQDYVWEVTVYNRELNAYDTQVMWIGTGERLDDLIEVIDQLSSEIW